MNADQVRAFVAAKYPHAMQSPLAQAVGAFCAADQADRAVGFAKLQAAATCAERRELLADAMAHAEACLAACDGWTVETLGHNVESAFGGELDADECDDVAREALKRFAAQPAGADLVCQGRAYRDGQWLPWHTISATVYENRMRWPRDGYQVRIAKAGA